MVRSSSPVVRPRPSTGNRTGCHKRDRVQALVDVAATYLETSFEVQEDGGFCAATWSGIPIGRYRLRTFPRR